MIDERMPSGSRAASAFSWPRWQTVSRPVSKSTSTLLPSRWNSSTIWRASVMSGTPRKVTGWSVSRVAHRIGNTAFLLADGITRPLSGRPPRTIRLAKGASAFRSESMPSRTVSR